MWLWKRSCSGQRWSTCPTKPAGRSRMLAIATVGVMLLALSCRFEEDLVQPSQTAEQAESVKSGKTGEKVVPAGTAEALAGKPGTGERRQAAADPASPKNPWEHLQMTRTTLELPVPAEDSVAMVDVLVPEGWVVRDGLPGNVYVPVGTEGPNLPVSYGVSVVCGGKCGAGVRSSLEGLLRGRLEQLKKSPWSPAELGGVEPSAEPSAVARVQVVEEDWEFNGVGMWVARVEPSETSTPTLAGYHRLVCVSHRDGDRAGVQVLIRAPLDLPAATYRNLLTGCRSARAVAIGEQQ